MRWGRESQGVDTLHQGEQTIATDVGKAEALAGVFFPQLPPQRTVEQQGIDDSWSTSKPPGFSERIGFSPSEVITAVRRQRSDAALGRNEISPRLFRKCLFTLLPCLVQLFSACLQCGYHPREWHTVRVLALRKPGKDDYLVSRSYRPISLLPALGKIMETLVSRHLIRFLETKCLLSPYQFGFRAGKEIM